MGFKIKFQKPRDDDGNETDYKNREPSKRGRMTRNGVFMVDVKQIKVTQAGKDAKNPGLHMFDIGIEIVEDKGNAKIKGLNSDVGKRTGLSIMLEGEVAEGDLAGTPFVTMNLYPFLASLGMSEADINKRCAKGAEIDSDKMISWVKKNCRGYVIIKEGKPYQGRIGHEVSTFVPQKYYEEQVGSGAWSWPLSDEFLGGRKVDDDFDDEDDDDTVEIEDTGTSTDSSSGTDEMFS